ncbi:MAG: hypothetical protein ACRC8K_19665 [Waterburya sp.]
MNGNLEVKALIYIYINTLGTSISLYKKHGDDYSLIDLKILTTISKKQISSELINLLKSNKIANIIYDKFTIYVHTTSELLAKKLVSRIKNNLDLSSYGKKSYLEQMTDEVTNIELNNLYLSFISDLDDSELKINNTHLEKKIKSLRSNYISENYEINPKLELYALLIGYKTITDNRFLFASVKDYYSEEINAMNLGFYY